MIYIEADPFSPPHVPRILASFQRSEAWSRRIITCGAIRLYIPHTEILSIQPHPELSCVLDLPTLPVPLSLQRHASGFESVRKMAAPSVSLGSINKGHVYKNEEQQLVKASKISFPGIPS